MQELWQAVVVRAIKDAVGCENSAEARRERPIAERWITQRGKDYRRACALAGMCPDFIADQYAAGAFTAEKFRESKEETQ
ncbi:hypothetical protein [Roseivivax jejudonensis]|nr:hypothetical protein [Roseivivax jejudonensis]